MSSEDPKPPQASMRLRLPLDQLSPADFERLCLWMVRRESFEAVEHLGEAGSRSPRSGRPQDRLRRGRRYPARGNTSGSGEAPEPTPDAGWDS